MFIILIRTAILYFLVVLTMRLMGKKQIGQLQPFELAIAIMISELASLPMQDTKIPLLNGIIPIVTLLILEITLSLLELKSEFARKLFSGEPSIIIKNGKIDIKQLKINKYNINDLMEEIRLQGYYNISDVQYAILETSGQLSIIPRTELSSVTKQDMKVQTVQDALPITLILDGKVNYKNLKLLKKDTNWLNRKLSKYNITNVKEVFIALVDSKGEFYFQERKSDNP